MSQENHPGESTHLLPLSTSSISPFVPWIARYLQCKTPFQSLILTLIHLYQLTNPDLASIRFKLGFQIQSFSFLFKKVSSPFSFPDQLLISFHSFLFLSHTDFDFTRILLHLYLFPLSLSQSKANPSRRGNLSSFST